jgi:DNA-binding NtrC family response regulator
MGSHYPSAIDGECNICNFWCYFEYHELSSLASNLIYVLSSARPEHLEARMKTAAEGSLAVVSILNPRPSVRVRDRRTALAKVLETVARRVQSGQESSVLRSQFEAALQEALRVPRVRLREGASPYPAAIAGAADSARRVSVHVATPRGTPPVVLEATLDKDRHFDGWDGQLFAVAAHLAALIMEMERCRVGGARHGSIVRRSEPEMPSLIGDSPAMRTLRDNITRVAETDFIVLIEGESGTGKELVARQLHQLSHRRHGPFVAVNCAAIVESLLEAELFGIEDRTATGVRGRRGKFEHADGGTLFLDEVSDLAPAAQAKLLRAIQELTVERVGGHATRKVDARIVVATNRSLRELVASGRFREDLFYRLSGVELHVPPLTARRQDIPDLAAFFLSRYQTPRPITLSAEAAQAMQVYDWPGNVRELERTIEGAVTLAATNSITIQDLPKTLRGDCAEALRLALDRHDSMRAWGARYARLTLERCQQNKRRACVVLDISYHTLMAYLRWKPCDESPESSSQAWPEVVRGPCLPGERTRAERQLAQTLCG